MRSNLMDVGKIPRDADSDSVNSFWKWLLLLLNDQDGSKSWQDKMRPCSFD